MCMVLVIDVRFCTSSVIKSIPLAYIISLLDMLVGSFDIASLRYMHNKIGFRLSPWEAPIVVFNGVVLWLFIFIVRKVFGRRYFISFSLSEDKNLLLTLQSCHHLKWRHQGQLSHTTPLAKLNETPKLENIRPICIAATLRKILSNITLNRMVKPKKSSLALLNRPSWKVGQQQTSYGFQHGDHIQNKEKSYSNMHRYIICLQRHR